MSMPQMTQYGAGPQRGPMNQTLMGSLNNVGQRGIPGNAGLSQAALQRQAGGGVNIGGLGGASGAHLAMPVMHHCLISNLEIFATVTDIRCRATSISCHTHCGCTAPLV